MKLKISLSTDVCLTKRPKEAFLTASKEWPFVIVSGKIRASLLGRFLYTKTPKLVSFFIISAVQSQQWKKVFNLLLSGCLIAYFVHGGAANFLIPAMLSVLVLLLIYSLGVATPAYRFVSHLVYSGAIGFCFSVSKIAASLTNVN